MTYLEAKRAYLVGVLTENNWQVSRAAKAAGMHRTNLYKLMDRYGIHPRAIPAEGLPVAPAAPQRPMLTIRTVRFRGT